MFLRQLFIAMTFEELKDKALSLPLEPGVYLMQDKSGQIIYVGKAKKLKNRVSQYFPLLPSTRKTTVIESRQNAVVYGLPPCTTCSTPSASTHPPYAIMLKCWIIFNNYYRWFIVR